MKKFICVCCFSLLLAKAFCQISSQEYIVVSIGDTYKISQHGEQTYFWIIPADAVTSFNAELSRLFISDFSTNNLTDCCAGNATDPVVVTQASNFILDHDFQSKLEMLKRIVVQNRRRVQTIIKKWESGQTQTIKVFVTAISGGFCHCRYHPIGRERTGYSGEIFLPKSGVFQLSEKFWKTPAADFLLERDYSKLVFDIIPN